MQVTYDGVHSLLIGDFINGKFDENGFIDTWKDLHLIPTTVPVIQPPPLKTNTIDVPGANGSVDMTEILTGRPLYENRTGSIDFYVDNSAEEYCGKITDEDIPGAYRWDYAYDKILNSIHGFRKKVILTDARSYYYEGRVSINSYKSDKLTGTISLDYDLEPFKMSVNSTTEPWLWNPFDFIHGIIPEDYQQRFKYPVVVGDSPGFDMNRDITGIVPQIPIITAQPNTSSLDPVDWVKIKESQEFPGITFKPYGSNTWITIEFRETDFVDDPLLGPVYRLTNPTASNGYLLTIGSPDPDYKFEWKYNNYFRNSGNTIIPTTFYFDFRPRRL